LLQEHYGEFNAVQQLDCLINGNLRIPDLVVFAAARFEGGILIDPPLLCVEILSPGQTGRDLFDKCDEYHRAGVPECWVILPKRGPQGVFRCYPDSDPLTESSRLTFGAVVIDVPKLFSNLPETAL
jgi:Uma2 family endonuclease